jgi:hypothetical protein
MSTQENVLDTASVPNPMAKPGSQPRMPVQRTAAAGSPLNFAPVAPTPMPGQAPLHLAPAASMAPHVNVPAYSGPPIDESLEIWLIQKQKLDFGPFSMSEVKRQIMKGDIQGEHVIVDSDSGKRHHVKNHPYLARFVAEAEMRHDEQKRIEKDQHQRRREKRRTVWFLLFLLIIGGAGTAVALIWIKKHNEAPVVVEKVVTKTDADLEKILKGLSFEFPKPTIRARHRGKGGKLGGFSGGEDFDAPTMMGDVTQEGGEEQLSPEQIQSVMNSSRGRSLAICIAEEKRRNSGMHQVELEFIVHGNGQVTAVRVNGQKGTPIASCMFQKMRAINFPKYNGPKTIAGFSFKVN